MIILVNISNFLNLKDSKKFKVIHKCGELNFGQILRSLISSGNLENIQVIEDNLLDVALFREAFLENSLDQKYTAK